MSDLALTRAELDERTCSVRHCRNDHGPLYLHGACHVQKPSWVSYHNGEIEIHCSECGSRVALVKVAES